MVFVDAAHIRGGTVKRSWWQIVSHEGTYVCARRTLVECTTLLDKYSGTRYWGSEPYMIQKVEERTYKPKRASQRTSEEES